MNSREFIASIPSNFRHFEAVDTSHPEALKDNEGIYFPVNDGAIGFLKVGESFRLVAFRANGQTCVLTPSVINYDQVNQAEREREICLSPYGKQLARIGVTRGDLYIALVADDGISIRIAVLFSDPAPLVMRAD